VSLKEQSSASQDIAKNVETISQMAQENFSTASNTAEAMRELESMTGTLQESVSRFKL
jgi:methyl-accepting chemotaxis protein